MPKCKIVSIDSMESKLFPQIVNFQNGQLQPSKTSRLQCTAFSDPKNGDTIMTVATKKMTYVGKENGSNDLCYQFLTIRNKKTNKIRLVPVSTVSLNVQMSNVNELLDSTLTTTKSTTRDLDKQFGSKKARIRIEQYEKMTMNVSNVEDELTRTVQNIPVSETDLTTPVVDDDDKFYKPPINRKATTVDKVYDLKTIIQEDELDSLKELAVEVLENPNNDKLTEFALEELSHIKKTSDNIEKCQILLYIDAIIKFFKTHTRYLNYKKFPLDPYPDIIKSKLLKEFTQITGNNRCRPVSMKDKGLCYIIVLALLISDYKVNLDSLSKSTGVSLKKLQTISRVLGTQSLSGQQRGTVVLKLPLPSLTGPAMSPAKRRRK